MSNKKHLGRAPQADTEQNDAGYGLEDALAELYAVIASVGEPGAGVLDAEIQVAGLLAVPALSGSTRSATETFAGTLIQEAARTEPRSSAAAFYRLLMALGSPSVKKMASGALRELTASGVYPPGWVTEIGKPVPGEAWHRYDVFGDDEAVLVTFSYGDDRHALLVRIDRTVLPTAVMVGITPEPDRLIEAVTDTGDDPFDQAEQIPLGRARQLIEAPLNRARQGGGRGLTASSATFLPVARAHVRRLPAEGGTEVAAYTAADRAAAVGAFLASPHAAEAGDPEVARFWAQALTGYSGRFPGEPPAQVGPRKVVAMLGHAASTFALTGEQRAGLRPAVTAWTRWAAENQGLGEAATERVLAALAAALDEFGTAYDDPQSVLARAYASDVATGDADVTDLAAAVTRRSVAVPYPDAPGTGQPWVDVTDPAARAEMVAREFATCTLDPGQTREDLLAAAARVVEELWSGEPPSTWEAARKLLADGHSRHDAIHALIGRSS